ncbi:substrate-binding periplasmic protein [Salinicola rhizosphaerae]|uniref:Amino acid ABC transporter n=1 Tax=Salinicola rhizosphaerae TaxID=1443141 RepID=A0ABQ3DVN3_9GAMM|nr:ABC transporter substrate-binding protein [Salinicola rhizosphaerae]GHB17109.1 amino acid ABC transporter [Salinicola rhizosphaerae]
MKKTLWISAIAGCLGAPLALAQESVVAASDVGYAPYSMVSNDGSLEGIDIDIAKGMSKYSGIDIKVIDQPWSTTFAGLNAGKFDIVLSAAAVTPERAGNMLFLEGYGDATDAVLVKKSAGEITKASDLQGMTLAINKGSSSGNWIREHSQQYDLTLAEYDKASDAVQAVITGQADGYMMYQSAAGWIALQNPLLAVSDFTTGGGRVYAYSVNNDNPELRNRLDAALECMKDDGELKAIFTRWTGITPKADSVSVNSQPGYGQPGFEGYDDTPHEHDCSAS